MSERILLGKPVWDRPSQKAEEPGACAEGEEQRGVGAETETCRLARSTTRSSHLCTEARNPRWGASGVLGRLLWHSRLGPPGVRNVSQGFGGSK